VDQLHIAVHVQLFLATDRNLSFRLRPYRILSKVFFFFFVGEKSSWSHNPLVCICQISKKKVREVTAVHFDRVMAPPYTTTKHCVYGTVTAE